MSQPQQDPQTLREVGIFLTNLKEDIDDIKTEVDEIKSALSKMMGVVFTAIIGPIIVGIIIAAVLR